MEDNHKAISIIIINLFGQMVFNKRSNVDRLIELQTDNLAQGVYTVSLTDDNKYIGQYKLAIE